jgi:hypothetical protein
MAKKKAAGKKAAKKAAKKASRKSPALRSQAAEANLDTGPLDAALYVTIAGETALQLVEYVHAPVTQPIQDFVVQVQEVSARPSDAVHDSGRAHDLAREIFQAHDQREMPYLRVIGRVLDELLNHRRFTTCSGGDVYYVLLDELEKQLPKAHRQRRALGAKPFDRTLNPGYRVIGNKLVALKGSSRADGKGSGPAYVQTTSTTQGGAEQGYRLTEVGQWLFDGWPELPELVRGRSRGTQ